jgi:anaerobic magnesium-protoporphyrin IX monomethyl ester cyclase
MVMTNTEQTKPLIVLVYPKIDHEKNYAYYWMPFSTLALAKVLISSGLADVKLFDGNQSGDDAWHAFLKENSERTVCFGLSIMTGGGQINHAIHMASSIRNYSSAPIVLGGPHVNVLPEQTLAHPLVNAVLVGPGQSSIVPFVEALLSKRLFETVPGLWMKGPNGIVRGPDNAPRVQDLNGYPWHLIDVESYVRDDPTVSPRTLNYVSSQGCVYRCQFCYELTYKRKYSKIPALQLLDEVEEMTQRFGIAGLKFYDADWFVDLKRADAFSRGLIDRGLNIRWAASINPNDVLRARRLFPKLMTQIARSGCSRLLMGVESGADRVLNEIIKKEVTRKQIMDVAREIADVGIIGSYTFIVGFPGESVREQDETFELIEEMWKLSPTPETRVHIFAPYPGTPLFEDSIAFGFEPPTKLEDWATYDYYKSQTPWTNGDLADKAARYTRMRLIPTGPLDPKHSRQCESTRMNV